MARVKVMIGANFGCINLFNKNGTPLDYAPYVTLHNLQTKKYYVADSVTPNEDEVSYDAAFSSDVTVRMTPGLYNLEIYTDSTMRTNIAYEEDWAHAIVVDPTPGQENDSSAPN
jgi:hypothetical protein